MTENTVHSCIVEDIWTNRYSEYGPAVDYCTEDSDGTLWVGNGEYKTQVNFCPFCGFKAETQRHSDEDARKIWKLEREKSKPLTPEQMKIFVDVYKKHNEIMAKQYIKFFKSQEMDEVKK